MADRQTDSQSERQTRATIRREAKNNEGVLSAKGCWREGGGGEVPREGWRGWALRALVSLSCVA